MNHYIMPFHMEVVPIEKLMLINFDKNPDRIYSGLELQYLKTQEEGEGYRVVAYRLDQHVDVYDEESLHIKDPGAFEVCGKGLATYKKVSYLTKEFLMTEEGIHIEFSFYDVENRLIDVKIIEHSKRKSKSFDMVAPVGVSSQNPVSFPAFAMYQFDLVRKKNTTMSLRIDGTDMKPDSFPVPIPKEGQFRYFTRYSYDSELVELWGKSEEVLETVEVGEVDTIIANKMRYHFEVNHDSCELKCMEFEHSKHQFKIVFEQPFPNCLTMEEGRIQGEFTIKMEDSIGDIAGEYQVIRRGLKVEITAIPTQGWKAKKTSFITRMMFQKKSIFCHWPKTYRYEQSIDLETKKSKCEWKRN